MKSEATAKAPGERWAGSGWMALVTSANSAETALPVEQ